LSKDDKLAAKVADSAEQFVEEQKNKANVPPSGQQPPPTDEKEKDLKKQIEDLKTKVTGKLEEVRKLKDAKKEEEAGKAEKDLNKLQDDLKKLQEKEEELKKQKELKKLTENVKKLEEIGLPIGWKRDDPRLVPHRWGWLVKILGWLLTAFAISLGAPFWFDLLTKFVNVRSSLKPKDPKEQK
jgi:seryl-tRNA synthetase